MIRSEREKAIDRVQKLLSHRLGGGTTAEEADTALLLAHRLMVTHGISLTEVEGGADPASEAAGRAERSGVDPDWDWSWADPTSEEVRSITGDHDECGCESTSPLWGGAAIAPMKIEMIADGIEARA